MGDWFINLDNEVVRRPCLFDSTVLSWLMKEKGMTYPEASQWVADWVHNKVNTLP
jgi:hypothetical protein